MSEDKLIDDPASWLEMPLSASAPVSRLDLLVAQRDDLVIRCLTGDEVPPEHLLDEFDPGWRDRYETDFEVFTAGVGRHRGQRQGGHRPRTERTALMYPQEWRARERPWIPHRDDPVSPLTRRLDLER
jgi:hypothetical protein